MTEQGTPRSPIVRCEGIARTYAGDSPVPALKPASFTVLAGEQIVVCGPSGSGKSTLMNLLGLLDSPTDGTYEFLGRNTAALSEAERAGMRARAIGFVFQSYHLMAGRSAAENVEIGLLYSGHRRRARATRALEALARVGVEHRAGADVTTLSGGERQRVAIARALVHSPSLLLADEPTGNLDSGTGAQMLALFDGLRDEGYTQIIVTHSDAIAAHCSRRFDLVDGLLREADPLTANAR